jgi:hypothetical protein
VSEHVLHTIATPAFIEAHCAPDMVGVASIVACRLWHEAVLQVNISWQVVCAAGTQTDVQDAGSGLVEQLAAHCELAPFQQESQAGQHADCGSVGFVLQAV